MLCLWYVRTLAPYLTCVMSVLELENVDLDADGDDDSVDEEFVLYDDLFCLACQKAFDTEHA